jgi:hypothetical protein
VALSPGQYTVSGRIAAATDKDLPISNLPVAIADGKAYSFYQSGIYNTTTKTVVAVPAGGYNLSTRYTGASTNAITRAGVSFAAGRVYTIGARGNITVASTILLDNTANR